MEIKNLLKSQAHQVFQAIANAKLKPSDFEWKSFVGFLSGRPVPRLELKDSDYYFEFDNAGKSFGSQWSPGEQKMEEWEQTASWDEQLVLVHHWLIYLKREFESPDLWGAISEGAEVLESAASADTSNAPFSDEEKAYIVQGIDEIKQYLRPPTSLTQNWLSPV
jgi:hypothetical protein